MKRSLIGWLAVVAAVVVAPRVVWTQNADLAAHVQGVKASIAKDAKALRQYEWVETVVISMKGDEKSRTQNRCYYGADGKIAKVQLSAPPKPQPAARGLKGRVIENKKEDISEYMKKAVAMVKSYTPPDPEKLQALHKSGHVTGTVVEAGKRHRITFSGYQVAGDAMGLDVDISNDHIVGVTIATYLDGPDDKVSLAIKYGALADGTGYPMQVTLDAPAQKMQVVIQNSGYKPLVK